MGGLLSSRRSAIAVPALDDGAHNACSACASNAPSRPALLVADQLQHVAAAPHGVAPHFRRVFRGAVPSSSGACGCGPAAPASRLRVDRRRVALAGDSVGVAARRLGDTPCRCHVRALGNAASWHEDTACGVGVPPRRRRIACAIGASRAQSCSSCRRDMHVASSRLLQPESGMAGCEGAVSAAICPIAMRRHAVLQFE